jgi:hypothetical protein
LVHLGDETSVGICAAALRDQLWRDSIAAGGKAYASDLAENSSVAAASIALLRDAQALESVLTFMKAHAETASHPGNQLSIWTTQRLAGSEANGMTRLRARIRARQDKTSTASRRGRKTIVQRV